MKTSIIKKVFNLLGVLMITMFFTRCDAGVGNVTDELLAETRTSPGFGKSGKNNNDMNICNCLTANFAMEDLNEKERLALLYMREEEKLARDVYVFLSGKWKHPTFENIKVAEERHMEAIKCLLDKYSLKDPVSDDVYGKFENKQLAGLYDALTAEGAVSLEKALVAGASIEDADIADLQNYFKDNSVDNADVKSVFENLMRGSRNHLRAFTGALDKLGVEFKPKYLDMASFTAIVNGDMERGNGICGGGKGGGKKSCSKDKYRNNQPCNGTGQGNGKGNGTCTHSNQGGNGNGDGQGNGNGCGKGKGK